MQHARAVALGLTQLFHIHRQNAGTACIDGRQRRIRFWRYWNYFSSSDDASAAACKRLFFTLALTRMLIVRRQYRFGGAKLCHLPAIKPQGHIAQVAYVVGAV